MPVVTQSWFGAGSSPTQPTFVVPPTVTTLAVTISGTSGGNTQVTGHPAGWGPFFTANLAVTPGETLYLQVGGAGGGNGESGPSNGAGRGVAGWPDGGVANLGPGFNKGGGGGGSSRIWRNGIGADLLIVVSGGGGVGYSTSVYPNPGIGNGLAPPGQPTSNGPTEGRGFTAGTTGGHPGTSSAGGASGSGGGTAGSLMQGGNGQAGIGTGINLTPSGGAGGGGIYGGGGGGPGAGGGGGMSYIDLSEGWSGTNWDLVKPLSVSLSQPFRGGTISFTWTIPSIVPGWSLGLVSRRRTPWVFEFPYFVDFTGLSELPRGWVTNAGHTLHVDGVTGFPAITFDNVAVPAGSSTIIVHAKALNTSEDTTVSISSTIGGETISVQNWPWDFDDKTGHCNGDGSSTSVSLAAPDNSRHLWTAAVLAPTQRHIYVADAAGFAHNSAATTAITHTFGSISINATARLCQLYVATTALTQAQIEDIWAMMGLV